MTIKSAPDLPSQLAVKVMHEIGSNDPDLYGRLQATLNAALAAAPQPMGCGLPCGYDCNGACFDWAAAPQPAPTHECPVCEETVTWTRPGSPYCGECAADNGRDVRMRSIGTAPQPAPDREALVQVIREASSAWSGYELRGPTRAEAIADALLARGVRLTGGDETLAWAVVRKDETLDIHSLFEFDDRPDPETWHLPEDADVVRVAIRVVEGGDDAA